MPLNTENRLLCYQALNAGQRKKRLKRLFEWIKEENQRISKFCNLYVKNLPKNVSETFLNQLFSKYGTVKSTKVSYSQEGILGKAFAFVCFSEAGEAHAAKVALNKANVFAELPELYVDYFQNKSERKEFLKLKRLASQNKIENISRKEITSNSNAARNGYLQQVNNIFQDPGNYKSFFRNCMDLPVVRSFPYTNQFVSQAINKNEFQSLVVSMLDPQTKRDQVGEALYSRLTRLSSIRHFEKLMYN